jgi:hypothetical protein
VLLRYRRNAITIIFGMFVLALIVSSDTLPSTPTLQITDIYGLAQALNIRPVMGTAYNVDATAVINSTGAIDAAGGDPSDCVRVDGTSIPCANPIPQITPVWVDAETPSSIPGGTNTSFTLSNAPNPPNSLHLFRNGVRLSQGVDYTLNGTSITFLGAQIPGSTDRLLADYRYLPN